jgi:Secretion system C-terminal sorting domain/Concanavalin A-like lectin/glucanases superfamily
MKKNLLLVLMFTAMTVSTSAQNTYFNVINYPAAGGRFVIPHNASFDLLTTNSRTYTFRMMVPTGTPASANGTNFGRIFTNADSPSATGGLGLTFGSSSTLPHKDIRVVDQSSQDGLNYGNFSNTAVVFGSLYDGNWHHIAVVYNDNSDLVTNPTRRAKVFFDGVFLAYASNGTNVKTGPLEIVNGLNLVFGSASTAGSAISAAFDDIRIWDRSLTPAEVATDVTAVINATNAPSTPGLLAAYNFESSTIGIVGGVPDITGKTNAGQAIVNLTTVFSTGSSTPTATLANKKFDKNAINVYLDTNTSILAISAPEDNKSISVAVYDLLGKMVASSKSNDNTAKISMSNVSSGVYLVNVTDGISSYTQKIVKN